MENAATGSADTNAAAFSTARRSFLLAIAAGLLALLATARVLQPSPFGFGTHQQLGLPPCTFTVMFGVRCPSCGMTTSWSYLTRGRIDRAVRANTGGALLGLVALAAAPWLLVCVLRGRWWLWRPEERSMLIAVSLVAAATLMDWAWRLLRS